MIKKVYIFAKVFFLLLFACTGLAQPPVTDPAMITSISGTEQGFVLFQERCMVCHGQMEQAPEPEMLRAMPAQRIYAALTTGAMQVHAQDLSDEYIRRVAESVSGELLGDSTIGDAANMPNQCSINSEFSMDKAGWNGWGNNPSNTRSQASSELSPAKVAKLQLKWAFGYAQGVSAFSQPSIVGGRVFVGSDTGYVYSLDAESGCVYWSFKPKSNVRATISIGPVEHENASYAAYFGDMKANVYALDVQTGELLWQQQGDENLSARISASPTLHDGTLYVPMSSWEEAAARASSYPCCTFQGNIAAYDGNTGEQLWKTYTIKSPPLKTKVNSSGVQLFGPAGAAVWNTPVVDPVGNAIYFGTANAFTYPAASTSDAVIALDMTTGAILWSQQIFANDAFLVGCGALPTENCPAELGPDSDIPSALILKQLSDGQRALLVSTRPGDVLSLNPDAAGALNWRVNASDYAGGGMMWGGAADDDNAYFGLRSGGMLAVSLEDGAVQWLSRFAESGSHNSPVSLINDAAFIGGSDGTIQALSKRDGSLLWQYDTNREFETVNGIKGHGGTISAAGMVIANGMLFASSGYMVIYGQPGNVLLAFSAEE